MDKNTRKSSKTKITLNNSKLVKYINLQINISIRYIQYKTNTTMY